MASEVTSLRVLERNKLPLLPPSTFLLWHVRALCHFTQSLDKCSTALPLFMLFLSLCAIHLYFKMSSLAGRLVFVMFEGRVYHDAYRPLFNCFIELTKRLGSNLRKKDLRKKNLVLLTDTSFVFEVGGNFTHWSYRNNKGASSLNGTNKLVQQQNNYR